MLSSVILNLVDYQLDKQPLFRGFIHIHAHNTFQMYFFIL